MSPLSAVLNERVISAARTEAGQQSCSLADLRPGQCARVQDVRDAAAPAVARRLVDLGFTPGAEVAVVRRAPMADPVIFRVAGCEIALRRAQARCIYVCLDA